MILIRSIKTLVIYFLVICSLKAQIQTFNFQLVGEEEKLMGKYHMYLSTDRKGFFWISSTSGVYRYDGLKIRYYPITKDGILAPNQNIQSLFFEDNQNNLWFSTYDAIQCFNRIEDDFTRIQIKPFNTVLNISYVIIFLNKDENFLWLKASGGNEKQEASEHIIGRYNTLTSQFESLPFLTKGQRFAIDTTKKGQLKQIIACPWFNGKGVEVINREKGEWQKKIHLQNLQPEAPTVRNAIIQNDSTSWLFSDIGLLEFHSIRGAVINKYSLDNTNSFSCWDGKFIENKKKILISFENEGLGIFDVHQKKLTRYNSPKKLFSSDTKFKRPREIFTGTENLLGISYYDKGVLLGQKTSEPFHNPIEEEGEKVIKSIIEDRLQRIWVLTEREGIYVFSKDRVLLTNFHPKDVNKKTRSYFEDLTIDNAGGVWCINNGTIFKIVPQVDLSKSKWEKIISTDLRIRSIHHGREERILIITNQGILDLNEHNKVYNLKISEEWKDHQTYSFRNTLKLDSIYALIPFQGNEIWYAKQEKSNVKILDRLLIKADAYCAIKNQKGDSIYIGTSKGLITYSQGQWHPSLLKNRKLVGYSILGLQEDKKGNIWMATDRGIKVARRKSKDIIHFDIADGLSGSIFSFNASLKDSEGKIWFGNNKGLTVFHPDSIQFSSPKPGAYMEAFWVNNLPLETKIAVSEIDSIQLKYYENTLSFELRTIGLYRPDESTLKYRLVGYDDKWANIKNGGIARFTKIPPGDFTLEFIGVNAAGIEGKKKTLQISIMPPFWQTLWFKLLMVLSIIILIISFVELTYRKKLKKQKALLERQKAISDERDRIGQELHDDMSGELSSILNISDDIILEGKVNGNKDRIERIFALAQQSLKNMREIIWALDKEQNYLIDLISFLRHYTINFLSDNKLKYHIEFPEEGISKIEVGSEKRRNIVLIIKECLHNVVKHACASKVELSLKLEQQKLLINLKDDGKGYNPSEITKGNGLINLKKRAMIIDGQINIHSEPEKGTHIKLIIPL